MRSDYMRIVGMALLFFVPFLGAVHLFDWNEVCFAECAREMLLTSDYLRPQLNFEPFWDNPPFFFWLQALSMKVFGVGEFAARFPNAIAGVLTLVLVYRLGIRLHDRSFGWLWALAWLGSLLPHLYFRSGLIDPWFNLLIFLGLYGFIEFRWMFFTRFEGKRFWQRYRYLLLGGSIAGLAMLVKGPAAYLLLLLTLLVYFARYRFRNKGYAYHLVLFSAAALSIPGLWLGFEAAAHGPQFALEYIERQFSLSALEGGYLVQTIGYQGLLLLLGGFPISIFALPNLWGDRQSQDELLESDTLASCKRSDMATWMQILFWVALLFSLLQASAAPFISLAFFPLTYLGTLTIWRAIRWNIRPKLVQYLLPGLGLLIGLVGISLPLIGQNSHWLQPIFAGNIFALERLEMAVDWYWWQGLPGLALVLGTLAAGWYWQNSRPWQAAQFAFTGGAVFVALSLLFNLENIEKYTQCSTIEFYESKLGQNCSIQALGFRSYAHLFYARKMPASTDCRLDESDGQSDQKVYFVAKVKDLHCIPQLQQCKELFRKEGLVYYEAAPR